MKMLDDAEALIAAGYLLQAYDRRKAEVRREVAMMGSEKVFDQSMTTLASLVCKLHPALIVNIDAKHHQGPNR